MKKKLLLLYFFFLSVSAFSQADIVVTNSDFSNYYIPGTNNTYTVTVTNLGPNAATNVHVTNAIPTGIDYFSWWGSNGSVGVNDPLDNTIATLAVGQTVTYTIVVEVPASYLGPLTSQTIVTSATADPNPACTQCIDTDVRATGADIEVINTNNQTQYIPGTTVTYTVTVANNGPLTAANVLVTNPIPAGITSFSWSGGGSSGTNVPLSDTIPSITAGSSVVYTITIQIPVGFTGNLTSTANTSTPTVDPVPGCPQCTDTDAQGFGADLEITNTDFQTTYVSGTTNTYTVTVTNNGPGVATDVQIDNAIPAGIPAANFSWSGSNGSSGTGTALSDLLPTLAAGSTVTYTITINIPGAMTAPLTSQTVVTSTSTDPTPACTQCTDTDTNTFGADIEVVNTDNNITYVQGTNNVYIVTVTNHGPMDATNVHVTNPIPGGITAFSWTGSNGSTGTNVNLDDTIPTLAAGTTVTYTITLGVPAAFTGPLTSTTTVTSATTDPTPGCTQCVDTDTQALAGADLVVLKTDYASVFIPGAQMSYDITITNNGPDVATNVDVSDAVPAGIPAANVSWTGPNGTGTGAINENFAALNVGQTLTYTVIVTVPSSYDQQTNLVNTVVVTSDTPDPNPDCPGCTDTDLPFAQANIVTSKSDSKATYLNNNELTYSITIANLGISDAVNVHVTDPMPPQITIMSWEGSNGSSGTGALQDVIASLAVGQVVTYQVTIFVPQNYDLTHANLTNTVTVTSDTPDPVPACPGCSDVDTAAPNWVTVNTATYSLQELVEDVLIHSDCANVSNFTSQGYVGNTLPTNQNSCVGYFHHNNSDFPIKDGVIIGTAQVVGFQGQYTAGNNLPGSGAGDPQLQQVSNANGGTSGINDAAFVQFDFTPLTDSFSFKFLFASEEYGPFQCTFGDVFAFLLTDLSAPIVPGVNPINVAIIPDVTPPTAVSVLTVRDQAYNGGCPSVNPQWYDIHNADFPALSAINIRGQLLPMIASATVIPNHNYRIKLAIGDYQDSIVNSAVFLEAGSFNVGQTDVFDPNNSTFPDLVGPAAGCPGETFVLQAGSSPIAGATYQWFMNDLEMAGETNYTLSVDEAGVYSVIVTVGGSGGGCQQTDSITVEYLPDMPLGNPTELLVCAGQPADLEEINAAILNGLNPNQYSIQYHHSAQDALDVNNPIPNYNAYDGINGDMNLDGEPIYASIEDLLGSGCIGVRMFTLNTYPCGNPVTPPDMYLCDTNNDGTENFDISGIPAIALGANTTADYTITLHYNQADADSPSNAIDPTLPFPGSEGTQIFIRMETVTDPTVFATTFFTLHLYPDPDAIIAASTTSVCVGGTQPVITFTGQGGTAPYTFTYTINGSTSSTVTSPTGSDSATITIPTTAPDTFDVDLINVADAHCDTNQTESITVTVNPGPEAVLQAPIVTACQNGPSPTVTIVGSGGIPPYTFTYTLCSGGPQTILSDAAGQATVSIPTAIVGACVFNLLDVSDANCTSAQDDSVTFTVKPLPDATASVSATSVCQSGTSPVITFTGSGSTAPYTFDYTLNGTAQPAVVSDASGIATVTVPTGSVGNQVVVITNVSANGCSQGQNDTVTVAVNPLPTATATASALSACANGTQPVITITGSGGTSPYTFAYTMNGTAQTAVSNAAGIATVAITMTAGTYDFMLTGVSDAACSGPATDALTVTILPVPEATVTTSAASACQGGASPVLTFTGSGGTAPYTFAYTINGTAYTLTTITGDSATANIDTSVVGGQAVVLTGVSDASCSNVQNDALTVTIQGLPTATMQADVTAVCQNGTSPVITFTGAGGTSPYTFTYTIDNGTPLTIATAAGSDSVTLAVPTGTVGISTYELTGVAEGGPDACSQAQTGTVSITVNPLPTATVSADAASVCQGGTSPVVTFTGAGGIAPYTFTYTLNGTSQTAVSNASGIATVSVATTAPGTFDYVLTGVSESGATTCSQAQSGSVTVTVNPLPAAQLTVSDTAVCLDDTNLPVVTLTGSGGMAPYTFTVTVDGTSQTLVSNASGVSTFTLATGTAMDHIVTLDSVSDSATPSCGQAVGQTATVSVIAPPAAPVLTDIRLCDDNNDGFTCFNLQSAASQATGGNANLAVAFFLTAPDAALGSPLNDIDNIANFCNNIPVHQTLYVRLWNVNAPDCASVGTLELYVDPRPVALSPIADYELCDNDGNGTESFDLTGYTGNIVANPAGLTLTFYQSQSDAQSGNNPIASPYVSAGETIWVNIANAYCQTVTSFNVVVNPLPQLTLPLQAMTSCIGADGLADFDLAGHIPVITQEPGVTVGFYASQADATVPQSPLPSPYHSAGGTIWVRLENADCFVLAPLDLIGATGPAIDTTPDALSVCDDNNDCFGVFDLTQAAADIWDSSSIPAGVEFHYYLTPEDAEQQTQNFIADPTAYPNNVPCNQTIYVSVTAPGSTCPSVAPLQLIVVPRPVANDDVQPVEQCDGEDNDGLAYFNLADQALLDEILGGLDGTIHTVTYYATAADVPNNPIPFNGWAAYQSATADIIAVVTHTASGCRDQVTVPLVVLALPAVADIPPYRLCDDDFDQFMSFDIAGYVSGFLVAGQTAAFYASEADALSGNNPLVSPYTNTVPGSQYIWIVVAQGGCSHLTGMDIVVDPKPQPHLLAPDDTLLFSCDDNNDGFAPFDLADIADAMQMGVPATQMVINFYLTEQDAVAGNLPIDQTIPYVNVTIWNQTLYAGVNNPETPGNCRSVWPVTLTVIPGAIAAELSDLVECDDDQDGFTQFNLTEQEAAIIALQTGPAPYQIRYFESASDAAQGINPIGNITNYTNQTAFVQQIWYRVDVTGGCHDEDSFLIKVNVPFDLPATLGLFTKCADADGNQLIGWDLPVEVPVPGITNAYQVHYYHSYAEALTDTDEIMDPANYTNQGPVDDLGVMVENLATGCKSYTMATIRVLPLPHPQQLQDDVLVMCEENGSDTATFDLTQFEDELANGDMGMTFTYHTSLADAESGTAAIPASDVTAYVSSGGTVYIRVEQHTLPDDTGAYCHTVVSITLQVDQQPDLAPGKFLTGCEVPAGTGQMSFDLNAIIAEMMPGVDTSGFTFAFSDANGPISAADALDYTNQANPQTITVEATNTATGCKATQTFELIVKPGATAAGYAFAAQCDDFGDLTDGIAEFDLTQADATVLNGQPAGQFVVTYYADPADAAAGTNPIDAASAVAYQSGTGQVYAVVSNLGTGPTPDPAPCRSDVVTVSFTVEPLVAPAIDGGHTVCINYTTGAVESYATLTASPSGAGYAYQWFLDGVDTGLTGQSIDVDLPGDYTVSITSAAGCVSGPSAVHTVVESSVPVNPTYTVSGAFQDHQSIQVHVDGINPEAFEYSLDGGPWLANGGLFENVGPGEHVIVVRGACGNTGDVVVHLVNYPHFFTPNGDGYNDLWNTVGLANDGRTKIYIFDRYGKLIKQIAPDIIGGESGNGWDGTYNGHPMPSTDYWFSVEYPDPQTGAMKEFRAHFSLKR